MNENTPINGQQPVPQPNFSGTPQPNYVGVPQQGYMPYGVPYAQAVKPKVNIEFTKAEKIMAFVSAGLAFLFANFVLWYATGFFTTAFYTLLFTAILVYLGKTGHTLKASHKVWAGVMYAFSAVFSITANSLIKGLDVIFLILGGASLVYSATAEKPLFGRFAPFDIFKSSVDNPLSNMGREFSAVNSSLKGNRAGKNIKSAIIGLLLAVPLTAVVAGLLMSADKGVEDMLNSLAEAVSFDNIFSLGMRIGVSVPIAGYIFGLIISHTRPELIKKTDEEKCEKSLHNIRLVPNTAVYISVTPICVLYVLFFISQVNYFTSAFMGTLPENYSYAEYARRGFFELFAIELINAGVIFFIDLFSKKTGEEKPFTLKLYSVVISVFTLLITATAISKMVMYIDTYGLTQLRVYTTWFMVLTALMFVYIIIRQFKRDFPFMRAAAVTFTLMFTLLCFSRPDALIARYNMENCADTLTFRDITEMSDLSSDAAAVVTEIKYRELINSKYFDDNRMLEQFCDNGTTGYEYICKRAEKHLDRSVFNEFNLSAAKLRSQL